MKITQIETVLSRPPVSSRPERRDLTRDSSTFPAFAPSRFQESKRGTVPDTSSMNFPVIDMTQVRSLRFGRDDIQKEPHPTLRQTPVVLPAKGFGLKTEHAP